MMQAAKQPDGTMNSTIRIMLLAGMTAAAAVALLAPALGSGAHGMKMPSSSSDSTAEVPMPTGPDALRQIVQDQCVLNWQQHQDPSPCDRVFLADPKAGRSGYAVLADHKGGAHYLLVPTQTMSGTDGGELLDPDLPNYFAEAWHSRDLIAQFVGHEVPRTAIGLAVNTAHTRTQNQFHIHIDCLRRDVVESLRTAAERMTDTWSPVDVAGSTFQGMRIMAEGLDGSNLFELLAGLKSDTRHHMGDYTLVAAGMQFKSGPGFIVITATGPTGELLMDSTCTVAGGGG
jgi:CDP-diacylglycerol pyrophosphatase